MSQPPSLSDRFTSVHLMPVLGGVGAFVPNDDGKPDMIGFNKEAAVLRESIEEKADKPVTFVELNSDTAKPAPDPFDRVA